MRKLVLLVALAACGGGHIPTSRLVDADVRLVADVQYFASRFAWERTIWRSPSDDVASWPTRVAVSMDRFACEIPNSSVYEPQPNEPYRCLTRWRRPRTW